MKITPITYSKNNSLKMQSFSGLWGKTSRNVDYDEALGIPKTEDIYYYYPFSDEKQDEIEKIRTENTSVKVEGNSKYKVEQCKICQVLPFSQNDYNDYCSIPENTKLSKFMKRIHINVMDKYLNKTYGNKQNSAINYNIPLDIWL